MTQLSDGELGAIAVVDACSFLLGSGWREYPPEPDTGGRVFYKAFQTPTGQRVDEPEKDAVQVRVAVSHLRGAYWSYEIDIRCQLSGDVWTKVHLWALPDDIREGIKVIPTLLQCWEFMAGKFREFEQQKRPEHDV